MNKRFFPFAVLMTCAFLLDGCGALLPVSVSTPLPAEMIGTEIVQTSAALATQTAEAAPSSTATLIPSRTPFPTETRRPTQTPSITPSPTVTFVVHIPSFITPVDTIEYHTPDPERSTPRPQPTVMQVWGASLWGKTPKDGTVFAPGSAFTAWCRISNNTRNIWDQHQVDFVYFQGDKFYAPVNKVVDLPTSTGPNEIVEIYVKMIAPLTPGSYKMTYLLHEGDRYYLLVSWTITVK
jgi:hypothetical protein